MTPVLTKEMTEEIEKILKNSNRAEVLIEQGKIVIVEIKRKVKIKE